MIQHSDLTLDCEYFSPLWRLQVSVSVAVPHIRTEAWQLWLRRILTDNEQHAPPRRRGWQDIDQAYIIPIWNATRTRCHASCSNGNGGEGKKELRLEWNGQLEQYQLYQASSPSELRCMPVERVFGRVLLRWLGDHGLIRVFALYAMLFRYGCG